MAPQQAEYDDISAMGSTPTVGVILNMCNITVHSWTVERDVISWHVNKTTVRHHSFHDIIIT
jgi:hypothetical protein